MMQTTLRIVMPALIAIGLAASLRAEDKPGYIGVQIKKTDDGKGALVQTVLDDSPAAKAGLKANDLILKIDGNEFGDLADFVKRVRAFKPGDKFTLAIQRDGKDMEIKITAGEAPAMK